MDTRLYQLPSKIYCKRDRFDSDSGFSSESSSTDELSELVNFEPKFGPIQRPLSGQKRSDPWSRRVVIESDIFEPKSIVPMFSIWSLTSEDEEILKRKGCKPIRSGPGPKYNGASKDDPSFSSRYYSLFGETFSKPGLSTNIEADLKSLSAAFRKWLLMRDIVVAVTLLKQQYRR